MRSKNIRIIILIASICAAIMTACDSKKSSETSSNKDSKTASVSDITEINTEDSNFEIPENAVYCQT
ncbi:MAG: hypothetical protein IKL31_10240, partial [Ruminococcus sp.]|nr:hypothetical protein [Ruminococcus sp.]